MRTSRPGPTAQRAPSPIRFFASKDRGSTRSRSGPCTRASSSPATSAFSARARSFYHLEIQLGYQHRGAQELLLRSAPARRLAIAESIAGDTAVGHALAHCQAIETLADVEPPLYAHAVRGIALELERLSNHVGDLGSLCNDIGFLPGASWFGRLRGEFLNLLLELSGNRFGRGLLQPGGVRFGLSAAQREDFLAAPGRGGAGPQGHGAGHVRFAVRRLALRAHRRRDARDRARARSGRSGRPRQRL